MNQKILAAVPALILYAAYLTFAAFQEPDTKRTTDFAPRNYGVTDKDIAKPRKMIYETLTMRAPSPEAIMFQIKQFMNGNQFNGKVISHSITHEPITGWVGTVIFSRPEPMWKTTKQEP
jgi:hypothetical protein